MSVKSLFLILGLVVVLLPACSEKQKQADQMEQEMIALDSTSESLSESISAPLSLQDSTPARPETTSPEVTPPVTPPVTRASEPVPVADASAIPDEEKPAALAPMPTKAPAGYAYTIQVAACEDTTYSRHLVKLFTKRGFKPFVAKINVGGQTFYRVRVGGYHTMSEARRVQAELLDKYSLQTWIDRLNP